MALIATQTMKKPFDAISAGNLTFTLTAGNTGGDTIAITGREILIVFNSDGASARTFTIASQADEKGRTGDITNYSLAVGEYAAFAGGLTNSPGWKNPSTNLITITPSNAAVKWAVLKLPDGFPS
jgi:hypothetical protein